MEKKYFCVVILFIGLCHGVSKASECTARGRFPNDEYADCRGYTMCLLGGLTNFTQYKLMCPLGSVYSHLEEQCTNATNYKCFPNFNCTSVGNFAVPESIDCATFVACIEGLDGVGTARVVGCPPNTLYNSTAGVCVNSTLFSCKTPRTIGNQSGIQIVDPPIGGVDEPNVWTGNNAVITNLSCLMLYSIIFLQSVLK